jgi:hypothetical protein
MKLIDNRKPRGLFIHEALLFSRFDSLLVGNFLPGLCLEDCSVLQERSFFDGHKLEVQAIGIEPPLEL